MTKKRKISMEGKEYKNKNERTDNEDNGSSINNNLKKPQKEQAEKGSGEELVQQQEESNALSEITADNEISVEVTNEEKLAEMQDKYLRLAAEFDNYRKRTLREKMELAKSAGECILKGIINIMDDFERALKLIEPVKDCVAIKDGIDLIYSKFQDFLKQNGVKEIESLNKDFNVDLHEAITKVPVQDEKLKGKVVEVIEKGYYLNDKVMRFSKVVVGE